MAYRSTKTYGYDLGLSCCYRNWRDDGHCSKLHGYALSFVLTFEANELDKRGWVVDFGCLKPVKTWLNLMFDHTTIISEDDPELKLFKQLNLANLIDLRTLRSEISCEWFAIHVYRFVSDWLLKYQEYDERCRLVSVEVREHGANSAIYAPQMSDTLMLSSEMLLAAAGKAVNNT